MKASIMDAGESLSIACRIQTGLPLPDVTLRRVDGRPVESKEQIFDEKANMLVVDFDRNDVNSYDAMFECVAKNKFEEVSDMIFAGPGSIPPSHTHTRINENIKLV